MDYSKNYINWIAGLTKDQFDIFIKAFIKNFWKVDAVVITDGKGDGGIDVKIFEDKKERKIPLQITIDKNVYVKLEKDLVKISSLTEKHGYSNTFYFYYSRGASEGKVIELVDKAREDYSLELKVFDNKAIASYLDRPDYFLSRETLRNFLGGFVQDEDSYFDENQKLYFDYLSYADDSKELKERFITSFILNELYKSNDVSISIQDLINRINDEFEINVSKQYCDRLIQNLFSTQKIEKVNNDNYKLSENESKNIKIIRENSELLERDFSSKLQIIINDSASVIEIRKLIDRLKAIFISQNKIDLNEISNGYDEEDSIKEIRDFYDYVNDSFDDKNLSKLFIEQVFDLCTKNNFLAKISAGKLYKDLINNPEFSAYARRNKKEVFLDTPILIYLLLVMKEPDYNYDNYKFKIAKELFELIVVKEKSACYNTTQLYITELADHFQSAIRLLPIQELGLFESLGGSNNEILNLYMALKEEGLTDMSFRKYLESFGLSINRVENDESKEYLKQIFYKIFKDNHIQIDDVPPYNRDYKTRKDYERIEKTLGDVYSRSDVERRPRSLLFDSLFFFHINNLDEIIDPTVLTWDKTFQEFRKEFHPKNPNFSYWHLFTPGKFIDHMSLLKFKINSKAITNEVLSMIESEYEVVKGVRKLSDTLTSIIDLKSARGISLSKGLADIRDTYIYQINREHDEKIISNENLPVDDVLTNLIGYYSDEKGKYNFNDFIDSLKIDSVIDELLKLMSYENSYHLEYGRLSNDYKAKYDEIIKKTKSE
ncbi:hypothetical protein ACH3O9_13395 [Leeuwenhoekiella sp. A16]|uniref:hypothetical protein n=1 Tax=unclassified Leeuwenhoekiella TaxID=2615029 RepID=UPI003A801BFA